MSSHTWSHTQIENEKNHNTIVPALLGIEPNMSNKHLREHRYAPSSVRARVAHATGTIASHPTPTEAGKDIAKYSRNQITGTDIVYVSYLSLVQYLVFRSRKSSARIVARVAVSKSSLIYSLHLGVVVPGWSVVLYMTAATGCH